MSKIDNKLYKLLSELLGGKSSVKSRNAEVSNSTSMSSGNGTSAYSSGQMDVKDANIDKPAGGGDVLSSVIGLITTVGTMFYNDYQAKKAYDRQNEFYDNHLSMPAKVDEYRSAGLNPMALAGAGAGATSAPSVQQGAPVDIGSTLGAIIGAVNQSRRTSVENAYTKEETLSKKIQNEYERQKNELDIRERSVKVAREELGYDIDMQTLRKATTDADMQEILAVYYPSMLQADITNKEAQAALADAQTTLTEEQTNAVKQSISQAEERFPKEMAQIQAKTAEIIANTYVLREQKELTAEQRKKVIEETSNLVKERDAIIAKTKLLKKEYDCYNAIHSDVTVVPDETGSKDRIIVKSPDGKVRQFDMKGMEYNRARNLDGSKAK